MPILIISYLGGLLTILSPCVLPVLPLVLARVGQPFRSHGLPMLAGMTAAFSLVATLAAVGGSWVIAANQYGRYAAIVLLGFFGLTMIFPVLADRLTRPLVELGSRLSEPRLAEILGRIPFLASALLGIGTGLLWAPCAGPILGLILTTAALNGASVETSLLLLAYALGAATSLAAALLFGGRILSILKNHLQTADWIRRIAGAAVVAGVCAIALGLDTGILSRLSNDGTSAWEQFLLDQANLEQPIRSRPEASTGSALADPMAVSEASYETAFLKTLQAEGTFPRLSGATEWINSAPLTSQALRGKVVLIDFWTYSCINCLRTLPYLRAWAAKYREAGLVVIGVHTPEFSFEKSSSNVHQAVKDLDIGFPVAVDSNFVIWQAFNNQYWPAFYFIDAQGRIRHHQFGEGQYQESEKVIQRLLSEAGATGMPLKLAAPVGLGVQAAPADTPASSQETYLGFEHSRGFTSPSGRIVADEAHSYPGASTLRTGQWTLAGDWVVERERVVLNRPNGRIAYRFQARDLHLVLGPSSDGMAVHFKVSVDGKPPLLNHGFDTDEQGNGIINETRLYQLVRQASDGRDRLFEIEFLEPGAQAYVFTFG